MKRCLPLLLLLMMTSLSASADSFYVLAGYVCDKKADELRITYDGAYNEAGNAMMANRRETQWNPWDLIVAKNETHIDSLKTVTANCRLSNGVYTIEITPSPGNYNILGHCGGWMTAGAKVFKGSKEIYSIGRFENDCIGQKPIVTRVSVGPKRKRPVETSVRSEEFYK